MKRTPVVMLLAVLFGAGMLRAGEIDADLAATLQKADPNEVISTLVYLDDPVDLSAITAQADAQQATLAERHETVVLALRQKAQATQVQLGAHLDQLKSVGRIVDFEAFWIANLIRVDAVPDEIIRLAERDDVERVYANYPIELIEPVERQPGVGQRATMGGGPEPGVVAVRAPEVWDLGITGDGVLVATLDTGVAGNHPALASRWRGLDPAYAGHPEWAFFDPWTNWQFPQDSGSHGTHTMGSVCGGSPGNAVGVAPGAEWIHAAVIDRAGISQTVADAILAFQWLIDPDGNPLTNFDVPDVCSNSWGLTTGHGYPNCDETFWVFLDACEAAGIVIVFSAGNEGFSGLRRPSDRATDAYRTMAVASVNANIPGYPISGFSSRGPTNCTPSGDPAIKPDISAPGEDVISSVPGGGYSSFSGTSMASPHVNGVIALMREACPDLTVEEVKQAIYDTAFDLGAGGEDNNYGWGMVDAYEAVNMAFDLCGPSPPRVSQGYYETPVSTPVVVSLQASDHDGGPLPISYIITSLPAIGNTLRDDANDHVITAGELPYTLVNNNNQVTYTPDDGFFGYDTLQFRATDGGVPPEGGESEDATVTILTMFDPPQIVTDSLPDGFLGFPYGPLAIAVDQGQPPLEWSYVTDEYLEVDLETNAFSLLGSAQDWHADDGSWNFTLPFNFPFFGQEYGSVWVCSNGFLDFTSSSVDWSNSQSELIAATRIAPLWDDLRTDQGGDIYILALENEVTFRWDTVTYASGAPCNHSCTLYSDGRIRFHYGSGNNPITPTIGISEGDGTHYLLSAYDNLPNLANANSLEIIQPVPLPEGMMLSTAGVLSGTPLEFGVFEPRFKVVDSLGRSDEKPLSLEIQEQGTPGDLDGDGLVNAFDLAQLLGAWGPNPGHPADLNGDGIVDAADLAILLGAWTG